MRPFNLNRFLIQTLIVSLWINASEVFRYFIIVMPAIRAYLITVPDVAPMNWPVFGIWFIWDIILTGLTVFMQWLIADRFGNTTRNAVLAGSLSWAFFFGLFWMAMINMKLASLRLAFTALPLAWFELVVASLIAYSLEAGKWGRTESVSPK